MLQPSAERSGEPAVLWGSALGPSAQAPFRGGAHVLHQGSRVLKDNLHPRVDLGGQVLVSLGSAVDTSHPAPHGEVLAFLARRRRVTASGQRRSHVFHGEKKASESIQAAAVENHTLSRLKGRSPGLEARKSKVKSLEDWCLGRTRFLALRWLFLLSLHWSQGLGSCPGSL